MTSINTRNDVVTLINVFTVEPARQQELVDLLTRATDETIRHMPGFVSATIHKSLDGVRVTNYAQWRSREDFEAMLRNPAASPHLKEAAALATSFEPHLYQVSEVRGVARRQRWQATGAVATGRGERGAWCARRWSVRDRLAGDRAAGDWRAGVETCPRTQTGGGRSQHRPPGGG